MGMGDDIMFLGEAERIHEKTGKTIKPIAGSGWSPFFHKLPWLSKDGELSVNARDTNEKSDIHINYYLERKQNGRMIFRDYKPKPFRVKLTAYEVDFAIHQLTHYGVNEKFFLINPDFKDTFYSKNKDWGFDKYQELTDRLSKDVQVVRIHPGGKYKEPDLKNAVNIKSPNIRESVAIMSFASYAVGYDGFMNHITAGFEIPMVVICGGLVDESIIAYDTSTYISYDHPLTPCGATYNCPHCVEANKVITVDMVYEKCLKLL